MISSGLLYNLPVAENGAPAPKALASTLRRVRNAWRTVEYTEMSTEMQVTVLSDLYQLYADPSVDRQYLFSLLLELLEFDVECCTLGEKRE